MTIRVDQIIDCISLMNLKAHPHQSLASHLVGVAARSRCFAMCFDAPGQGHIAGLLHDLGKAEVEFQKRITHATNSSAEKGEKQPHAHHGAALALRHQLWPVAFVINGHHAGLHDRSDLQQVPTRQAYSEAAIEACVQKLKGAPEWNSTPWPISDYGTTLPSWLETLPFSSVKERLVKMRAVELYTRMLFSALVDADRLDTEDANRTEGSQANVTKRSGWRFGPSSLSVEKAPSHLLAMLDEAVASRCLAAKAKGASAAVLAVRSEVAAACLNASTKPRGVFTLSVPTGGGKTLASVAFALRHIAHHNRELAPGDPHRLRRIVIVIPYLNIIQQTTRELRAVFAHTDQDPVVLEHHSQAQDPQPKDKDLKTDADGWDKERPLRQLAAENWDAPIIVTTSVQFFDSIFSRRPADARKLHNLAQSVILFDEVQTLPPLLLQPILDVLQELAAPERPYGCSLVLCTATQPALGKGEGMDFGFESLSPIIPPEQAKEHFCRLKRVTYHGLEKGKPAPTLTHDQLAAAMLAAPRQQSLTIFNTRRQARALFDLLKAKSKSGDVPPEAVFHLSTWMYPAHRELVLKCVETRLTQGLPCLLVSTQCVEAGVDVDFPSVWRAFGPYDSIVQAAGRCNRHGIRETGHVYVFTPEDNATPKGTYGSAIDTTKLLNNLGLADPNNPESFEMYFRLLYQVTTPDLGGCAIQSEREQLHFEKVSEAFSFIDADNVPLLIETKRNSDSPNDQDLMLPDGVPLREWRAKATAKKYFTPDEWRALQPYVVNLSFPSSIKTKIFLSGSISPLVFPEDDDPVRGLRRSIIGHLYDDGPNGAGLDTTAEGLSIIDAL
jgi:CRISPR-associated endonuclease/helicase Cas3